jgi:uncharacterized membrane protein
MALTQGTLVVGVFKEAEQAHKAIEELRQAGFSDEEIGYLTRASANGPDETTETNIINSAVEGGLVGGVIGSAVILLLPGIGPIIAFGLLVAELSAIALGTLAGGLLGALINIGVPKEQAHHYQKALEEGHLVVTVIAQGSDAEALHILRRNGATDVTTRLSQYNTSLPF